ncbi:MAG: PH domain-containing protein [Gammaproteobacteria bacterium]|nr:PH domain-containing protein [Gammaproteobacteria bacterium]
MGLMSLATGNASEIDNEECREEIGQFLAPNEEISKAYRLFRDFFVFTSYRIILVNIQGITGKKVEYLSIPYRSITMFSVETAGIGMDDSELVLHVHGMEPIKKEFKKSIDIAAVQVCLAAHIASSG